MGHYTAVGALRCCKAGKGITGFATIQSLQQLRKQGKPVKESKELMPAGCYGSQRMQKTEVKSQR